MPCAHQRPKTHNCNEIKKIRWKNDRWHETLGVTKFCHSCPILAYHLFQVVLLHIVPEGSEAHTEQLRRSHFHTPRLAQRVGEVLAFEMLDVLLEIEPLFRQPARRRRDRV